MNMEVGRVGFWGKQFPIWRPFNGSTQMSNEHKMYSSGTEAYMQSTAPIQCMSDSDGSNLVVFFGPSGDLMLIVGVHQMFLVLPFSGNLMRIILI